MKQAGHRSPAHRAGRRVSADFNEVFFDNARCPRANVVGGENNGWKVAMTTLGFERGSSATTGHRRFARELDTIIDEAQKHTAGTPIR